VIKRIRFATRAAGTSPDDFAPAWREAVARVVETPAAARPARVAVCTTLRDPDDAVPRHDGVALEWFVDGDHLARYEMWLATAVGEAMSAAIDEVLDADASPLLDADEHVLRGEDWLEARWRDGGAKYKHMAVARRAEGLSQAEFSQRWQTRAGQLRRAGDRVVTAIPDDTLGLAYVQNHPRPRPGGEWAYDAVNEVWFDDLDGLQRRVEWFRENLRDGAEDDLVRENWFLVVREEVVRGA
jgi:hypothetical protein